MSETDSSIKCMGPSEIEELRRVLQDRDDELAAVSEQYHKLQTVANDNTGRTSRTSVGKSGNLGNGGDLELQKTVARLTDKINSLERKIDIIIYRM